MRRFSFVVAALTLIASGMIDVSPAQAVVCSEGTCISNCIRAGGRFCLRSCDRRIARRISSGICPWYGANWWQASYVAR